MRRIVAFIIFSLIVLAPGTAAAHPSVFPSIIAVNKTDSITFTVFGDESESPMVGVHVTLPSSFSYRRAVAAEGWNTRVEGNTFIIDGKEIQNSAFTSLTFTIVGVPSKTGLFQFPLSVRHKDGEHVEWNGEGVQPAPRVTVVKKINSDGTGASTRPAWQYFVPSILLIGGAAWFFFYTPKKKR